VLAAQLGVGRTRALLVTPLLANAHRMSNTARPIASDQRQERQNAPSRGKSEMLFMVIERFERNDMVPVYERVKQIGRGLPEGLKYIN